MVNEVTQNNMFLINAPAGSGKTTKIKNMVRDIADSEKYANILCITYTNRAAEELLEESYPHNVDISTIHAYISKLMKIYFSHNQILQLYFNIYGDAIKERIENPEEKENIKTSNDRYIEKYGKLNYDEVIKNIDRLYYNELDFNSLYSGGLSHDDLLSFANIVIKSFPILRKRINEKYKYVFIDEYQDTSSDVLDIFYSSIRGTKTTLYLFGDKMQQIYKNYDGKFEEKIIDFDLSNKLEINFRSTKSIINVLNSIYNDNGFKQRVDPNKDNQGDNKPKVIISDNIEESIEIEKAKYSDALVLYIANRKRFTSIGAGALYNAVSRMDRYSFVNKNGPVDVLTNNSSDNPDGLIELFFTLFNLRKDFENKKYGLVIKKIKDHVMFDEGVLSINEHKDKRVLFTIFNDVFLFMNKGCFVKDLLELLTEKNIVFKENIEPYLLDEDYGELMNVNVEEFSNLIDYLENPHVSTQHGVKGESHNTVLFVAENSNNPSVKMYEFLKLWSIVDVSLPDFERSYFRIYRFIKDIELSIETSISALKKETYTIHAATIDTRINEMVAEFKDNIYFNKIYFPLLDDYLNSKKRGVTKLKKCLNKNLMYGIFTAYKLFYVGCSRARENLIVILKKHEIDPFKDMLIKKLEETGFTVELA